MILPLRTPEGPSPKMTLLERLMEKTGDIPVLHRLIFVLMDLRDHIKYGADNVKWWFLHRFHPHHRYHVLRTGLKPGYHEFDTVILYAMFERFCSEYPYTKQTVLLDGKIESELDRLYKWWKEERPSAEKVLEDTLNTWHDKFVVNEKEGTALLKKEIKLENALKQADTKNMISLINLRGHVSW